MVSSHPTMDTTSSSSCEFTYCDVSSVEIVEFDLVPVSDDLSDHCPPVPSVYTVPDPLMGRGDSSAIRSGLNPSPSGDADREQDAHDNAHAHAHDHALVSHHGYSPGYPLTQLDDVSSIDSDDSSEREREQVAHGAHGAHDRALFNSPIPNPNPNGILSDEDIRLMCADVAASSLMSTL